MKKQILDMFEVLRSDDERAQGHAVSNLSLLVERTLIPALAKQNSDLLKQLNLLDLDVSAEEAHAILERICQVVLDDRVGIGVKVSMVHILGKFTQMEHLEVNLRFLATNHRALTNQQAYSTMAAINPSYFKKEHHSEVRALLKKYDIVKVLGELERNNEDLDDMIYYKWLHIRGVGLLDELDESSHAHYLRAVLRCLARHYKSMYNGGICGMLKLIPPAFLEKVPGKQVQSLLREYNIPEIFNELEGRTYDDLKEELKRECPAELQCILERDAAEEAENRLEEQKYHIELKKAIERFRAQIRARED
jgi:hypothetical protein